MQSIVPISIVLEIQKGAPSIDFEFDKVFDDNTVSTREAWKKMKPSGMDKKPGKGDKNISKKEKTQPPTLPEADKGKEKPTMPTQENCFGRRKYAEVVVETLKPKNPAEKSMRSEEPSSSSAIPGPASDRSSSVEPVTSDKVSYFCGNPFIEKTTGILHFYRN
ncbi:hypothetical protein FO519_010560, partial [Halicephalobus sp. NKZ332]